MITNFEITDNYGVTIDGTFIDLHNNFDLVGFSYDISAQHFTINWMKGNDDWIRKDEIDGVTLTHNNVKFLTIGPANKDSQLEDDKCLGEISFLPSSSREINDSLIPQNHPAANDDILFILESGRTIRICCDSIVLTYNKVDNVEPEAKIKTRALLRHIEVLGNNSSNRIVDDFQATEKQLINSFTTHTEELINHNEWHVALENLLENLYEIDFTLDKKAIDLAKDAIAECKMNYSNWIFIEELVR